MKKRRTTVAIVLAAAATALVAVLAGPVTSAASEQSDWPGPLGYVQRHPWPSFAGLLVVTALLAAGSAALSGRDTRRAPVALEPHARVLRDDDPTGFVGRRWLMDQLDAFLAAHRSGYVWLEAEAGLGKTTFAAHLVRERGYLSHSSRHARGETAARRNLAAQLVGVAGSDPVAAQSVPEFVDLLAQAARRGGRPVVIVLDGLDELDGDGDLPLGLPPILPDGVFVIGTYRTGYFPGSGEPQTTLRIQRTSTHNQQDLREFLEKLAEEQAIAARLAGKGMRSNEFIDQLMRVSAGVWVYLPYLRKEIQLGHRDVDQLGGLPTDLIGYYVETVSRWRSAESGPPSEEWRHTRLPVLAALAAADEPLDVDTVTAFAGTVDSDEVSYLCDYTFRPMLALTESTPPRYRVYHASFREFLHGTLPNPPAGGHPDHSRSLAEELRRATTAAHRRIADYYLVHFGELDDALPRLAADPSLADLHGGYPRRHLSRHLTAAGRVDDLHHLLACEHRQAGTGKGGNVWHAVHDRAGTLDAYLDDVDSGRRESRGPDARYALLAASVRDLTTNVPPVLVHLAVQAGVWSASRALLHFQVVRDPEARAWTAAMLAHHLPDGQREALCRDAVETAGTIAGDAARVAAVAALAPYLPDDLRVPLVGEALRLNRRRDIYSRAELLVPLAPHLAPEQLDDALAIAADMRQIDERCLALAALAPRLRDDQRTSAIDAALTVLRTDSPDVSDHQRVGALAALVPHLRGGQVDIAVTVAAAMPVLYHRRNALMALVPYLAGDQQEAALRRVLTEPYGDATGLRFALVLGNLLPYLGTDRLRESLDQAGALAAAYQLVRALTAAPDKGSPQWNQIRYLTERFARPWPGLTIQTDQLRAALAAAEAIDGRLSTDLYDLRGSDLAEAFPRLLLSGSEFAVGGAERRLSLAVLESRLAPGQLGLAVAAACAVVAAHDPPGAVGVEAIEARWDGPPASDERIELAPSLPVDRVRALLASTQVIGDATERVPAIAALVPHLARTRASGVDLALAAVREIPEAGRLPALATLAELVPAPRLGPLVTGAVAAERSYFGDGEAAALAALLPRLAEEHRVDVVDTLAADEPASLRSLGRLAAQLPERLRATVTEVAAETDPDQRLDELAAVAAYLPDDLAAALFQVPLEVNATVEETVAAVACQPPELAAILRDAACTYGYANEWDHWQWTLRRARPDARDGLRRAMAAAREINSNAEPLAALVVRLPESRRAGIRAHFLAAPPTYFGAWVLAALAPDLSTEQLGQALTVVHRVRDTASRVRLVVALSHHLPPDRFATELARARPLEANCEVLAEFVPYLNGAQRRQVREQAERYFADGRGYCPAILVAALAPYLPEDDRRPLLDRGLAATATISHSLAQRAALTSLAPRLSAGQLTVAVRAMTALSGRGTVEVAHALWDRAMALRLGPAEMSELLTGLLRDRARRDCLGIIGVAAPWLAAHGGTAAVEEWVAAIDDVGRWWP